LVEFCGYHLPIQYEDGIVQSHLHARSKAALFDVSHMAQLRLTGKDRVKFLETLVVGDIAELPLNHAKLSVYTNERGGIIDDTVISNRGDRLDIVVNAGCAEKDVAHITAHVTRFTAGGGEAKLERLDRSLLALQGPSAEAALAALVQRDLSQMPFMTNMDVTLAEFGACTVTRCGYTGEDGFEISVANSAAVALAERLLGLPGVALAGLGARDSLRLEAGLCLYGHDLDESISPVQASLSWLIGKRRKAEGGFLGADVILPQLKAGVDKKRVGLEISGPPAREGATIHSSDNTQVGYITSGTFSPSLNRSIAMGYVASALSKPGQAVLAKVRGKSYPTVVAKMPFVPTKYKRVDSK